jgi:2-oxoglutarate dehydrogenase E2 component (dihydrolipoamide succinyltransferase)
MIAIKVPPLGESIVEATISRWLKKEGEAVASGETIVELETDKITVEVPALKGGVLASRSKSEGDVVAVDEMLGEIDENATAGTPAGAPSAAVGAAPQSSAGSGAGAPPREQDATGAAGSRNQSAAPATAASQPAADVKASPPRPVPDTVARSTCCSAAS